MARSFACDPMDAETIALSNQYLGVCRLNGEYLALLGNKGTKTVFHVPLDSISKEEMQRLCNE